MRLLFIVLLVLAGSVTFGQKSKVSVKFTIDPQTDVFSEFEDEIIEIQNAIRDSIVRTLNAIYAYADFVTTTSSNQLAVKLVRRSSTNEEFDDMYFSGTLGASGDADPCTFDFKFTNYSEFNTMREDVRAVRLALSGKFKEHLSQNYDKEPFLAWNSKLPMVISDQRHFSIVGGKYVITLPYNKFQLNIDTFSSSFQIKVNYKNVNDVMYLIDENVKICGDQSKDIIIGSNTNLKGCLLIQSIKAAPNQGISGTIKFSNYKRAYYTNTGPRKYDQT